MGSNVIAAIIAGVVSATAPVIAEEANHQIDEAIYQRDQERAREQAETALEAFDNAAYEKNLRIAQEEIERVQREEEERLQIEYDMQHPVFRTYDLSWDELVAIARLCYQEQGSAIGAAAEASLIANRYEVHSGGRYSSIVSYLANSGWWGNAGSVMYSGRYVDPEVIGVVKLVLMDGMRVLPKYVDNHDCFSDITWISTGSVYSRWDYIPKETRIQSVYGVNSLFYGFFGNSDPFSIESEDLMNRVLAEYPEGYMDHYEFVNVEEAYKRTLEQ